MGTVSGEEEGEKETKETTEGSVQFNHVLSNFLGVKSGPLAGCCSRDA